MLRSDRRVLMLAMCKQSNGQSLKASSGHRDGATKVSLARVMVPGEEVVDNG